MPNTKCASVFVLGTFHFYNIDKICFKLPFLSVQQLHVHIAVNTLQGALVLKPPLELLYDRQHERLLTSSGPAHIVLFVSAIDTLVTQNP